MLFVIPWIVFILVAILAVPIASMIDKKKARARMGDDSHMEEAFDQMDDGDALEAVADDDEDAFGAEPVEAAEAFDDDLSAFE